MAHIHPIGELVNRSERVAVQHFARHLPDTYHLFHNLELPANRAGMATYEYDQIIVGEHAVYVVEVKGYQGTIRGNAREWDLGNGYFVPNPFSTTNNKARVLKELLRNADRRMDAVWVQPLVVLTDPQVVISLPPDQTGVVLSLADATALMIRDGRDMLTKLLVDRVCGILSSRFRARSRDQRVGDYEVLETIGKNTLYTTLFAHNPLLRARGRCVLKVYSLDAYAGEDAAKRHEEWIMRDANTIHQMPAHPNIVTVLHPFRWLNADGKPKIVLVREWCDGFSLRGVLDSGEEMPFARRVQIVRGVCEGLRHAHAHGVIHRDVRPENIIVPQAADAPVKLVNFDCARIEDSDVPTIASRIGKFLDERYVAPEVWEHASNVSRASDMYSAGIVLYEVLTGRAPYAKMRDAIAAGGLPQRPTAVEPSLPADVDQVVAKMCALRPANRYPSFDDVLGLLEVLEIL